MECILLKDKELRREIKDEQKGRIQITNEDLQKSNLKGDFI